jgi:hypothetical protein
MWNPQHDQQFFKDTIKRLSILIFFGSYALSRNVRWSMVCTGVLTGLLSGHLESTEITSVEPNVWRSTGRDLFMPNFSQLFQKHWSTVSLYVSSLFFRNDYDGLWPLLRMTHFHLAPEVEIRNPMVLPKRCILLMHHRRHHHPGLSVSEFSDAAMLMPSGVPFHFLTGRNWGQSKSMMHQLQGFIEKKAYCALDVAETYGSDKTEGYYRVLEPFQKEGPMILIVFPDKFGSQFWGDNRMFYRAGAFAAAMAAGIPIVDTVSMYPTFLDRHIFEAFATYVPEPWWPKPCAVFSDREASKQAFAEYRETYAKEIDHLVKSTESLFLEKCQELESIVAACDAKVTSSEQRCSRLVYRNHAEATIGQAP